MARTVPPHRILKPQPGSRPDLARRLASGFYRVQRDDDGSVENNYEGKFDAQIGSLRASEIDEKFVVLYDPDWIPDLDYFEDFIDESSPLYRQSVSGEIRRVWKTTCVYEQIAESHPRLVRFDHRDPWTGFPIFEKPLGLTLRAFLRQHRATMYPNNTTVTPATTTATTDSSTPTPATGSTRLSRIEPRYRPLIYQWALHLVSGLSFAHSHQVVFGDLNVDVCWLSPSLSLSLLGFIDAVYYDRVAFIQHDNDYRGSEGFHPCNVARPGRSLSRGDSGIANIKTDLFLWGCLVYELMTGHWPYSWSEIEPDSDWRTWKVEAKNRLDNRQWPVLEREHLGRIVHKCWEYQYGDTADLKRDLVTFLAGEGWEIDGEDGLRGFNATELFET